MLKVEFLSLLKPRVGVLQLCNSVIKYRLPSRECLTFLEAIVVGWIIITSAGMSGMVLAVSFFGSVVD